MFIYQASKAFIRIAIERRKWGRLLIVMIAVDILLAAGAWYAVGHFIG